MSEIKEKHREMVLRLAKPGQEILNTLTAWRCDLWHMGGCLMGEAAELHDAVVGMPHELEEELGDFAFYLVKCRCLFDSPLWTCGAIGNSISPQPNTIELMRLGGHFWDVVKRLVVYQKPADKPDSKYKGMTLKAVAEDLLNRMESRFLMVLHFYGLSLDQVLQGNWDKLADADKGRYASGQYSDQQAQDRRDKDNSQ